MQNPQLDPSHKHRGLPFQMKDDEFASRYHTWVRERQDDPEMRNWLKALALEDANDIRRACHIGEGTLPELPKARRAEKLECVLAKALSNGWVSEVTSSVELHHLPDESIDFETIVATLTKMGFIDVWHRTVEAWDIEMAIRQKLGIPSDGGSTLVEVIHIQASWAMSEFIGCFDNGLILELDIDHVSDKEAMDKIHSFLDGKEWSPDTLNQIAEVVRSTKRLIEEAHDDPEDIITV